MSKSLIGFIVIIIVGIIGVFIYSQTTSPEPNVSGTQSAPPTTQKTENTTKELTDSKGGVTATVTDLKIQDDKTVAMLVLSNHIYDISSMDVKGLSSFSGEKPSGYQILSEKMGGHHVESEMTFDGGLSGELIIGLNEDLIFNFNIE